MKIPEIEENCRFTYGGYFSETIKELFQESNLPISYILDLVDDNCGNWGCSHHVFYQGDELDKLMPNPTDVPWVLQCHRCMCLLDLVEDEITAEDIAKAFGLKDRRNIDYYLQCALRKLRKRGGRELRAVLETQPGIITAEVGPVETVAVDL